jgi:hypothetical protein
VGAVNWYSKELLSETEVAVERALDKLGRKIVQSARAKMREAKTGVKYPKQRVQSSAPYEAPAAQHGSYGLEGSVQMERTGRMERKVGSTLKGYPLYLELGTSKMDARPWLRPALYEHTGRTGEELFEGLIKK